MSNKSNINQIVCGILFLETFKLLDKWGEIADKILNSASAKKVFGERYYDRIENHGSFQLGLSNGSTNNSLRLTPSNLIITHNTTDGVFDSALSFLQNVVHEYIFPEIISDNILLVKRIGIVYTCPLNKEEISDYKKTIINKDNCESITDFRFSKKEASNAGVMQNNKDNYINKIITVGNLGNGMNGISYDYQYFFAPPDAQAGRKVNEIFTESLESLSRDIFQIIENKK